MSEEEIKIKLGDMLDFAKLSTDIGFADQHEKVELLEATLKLINNQKADKNKLINYIAIKENKDYEEIRKEFDI